MSIALNQTQSGTLPNDIVPSPPTIEHYLNITTRSGALTINPPVPNTKDLKNDSTTINKALEVEFKKLTYSDVSHRWAQ